MVIKQGAYTVLCECCEFIDDYNTDTLLNMICKYIFWYWPMLDQYQNIVSVFYIWNDISDASSDSVEEIKKYYKMD